MKELRNTMTLLWVGLFLCLIGCAGLHGAASDETSLGSRELDLISEAVYEVVVPKPTKDSLQYEKPLPMDLLPYAVRTDKYFSVGTAFAISAYEFVSAAHVMNLGNGSQFKEFFLRDRRGKVYAIEKILKYSKNRDFIVFSVRGAQVKRFLAVNKNPRLNQKVYAVGNALGEGIVIRDGLYTSDTPEEEAGEWKWIRFSAAASPGNSGGPLLDRDGKVIGIVLRKSPGENLNYAVPIAEVLRAHPNRALIQMKVRYILDNMDMTQRETLREEIALPKTYAELNAEMNAVIAQFSDKLLKNLLAEHRDTIFPRGPGSTRLFYKTYHAVFPHLIVKGKDGNWDAYHPKETREAVLEKNGRLVYGTLGTSVYMYLRKPDDIPLEKFYGDSKLFMDLILKGGSRYREIGPESIKITSMGKALEDYRFTDSYGRIWMVRTWLVEYNDRKVVTFSLPVPGGCIVIMRTDQTGSADQGDIPDLKVLSDFICVSYSGTFKEWREFLGLKDLLPSPLSTLEIQMKNDDVFRFRSKRLAFSYGPDTMKVSDTSDLRVHLGYFQEEGRTVWDITEIGIAEDRFKQSGYALSRVMKPPKELGDEYQNHWETMVERRFPYNRSAYYKDKVTIISAADNGGGESGAGKGPSGTILYTVAYMREGAVDQKEMEAKLATFMRTLVVYEKLKDPAAGAGNPDPEN